MGILLTTTSNIEGATIEQYLGVVVNNAVIGANIFSDMMASFTDFFGGTSGTYQNKMDQLYSIGLEQLERKARKLRANAIVGIKMDFDEISGQGKSMFMFSISGTAVKVKYASSMENDTKVSLEDDVVSSEVLYIEKFKKEWLACPTQFVGQEKWDLITSYKLKEFAEPLFAIISRYATYDSYCDYLKALPEDFVVEFLYKKFNTFPNVATHIIDKIGLFKPEKVLEMLKEGYSSKLCELLKIKKSYYTKSDIEVMGKIVETLNNLPDLGEVKEVSGGLLSKNKMKYFCPCGESQSPEDALKYYCPKCQRDKKGRTKEDKDVIADFINTVEILKELV